MTSLLAVTRLFSRDLVEHDHVALPLVRSFGVVMLTEVGKTLAEASPKRIVIPCPSMTLFAASWTRRIPAVWAPGLCCVGVACWPPESCSYSSSCPEVSPSQTWLDVAPRTTDLVRRVVSLPFGYI